VGALLSDTADDPAANCGPQAPSLWVDRDRAFDGAAVRRISPRQRRRWHRGPSWPVTSEELGEPNEFCRISMPASRSC